MEQLYEYTFWGPSTSNPTDDPNPRLEAYIEAARRRAEVRILLDSGFDQSDDAQDNPATCAYVNALASSEGLDLECKMANPTGTGIHNKMVLVNAGGQGYVHTGSINGSEASSKVNREFAIQVQSNEAYTYLADVFWYDWGEDEKHLVFLPLVMRKYLPLPNQPNLYIQDLIYSGSDEQVIIRNSGTGSQLMTGWWLNSVAGDQKFYFPDGYTLAAGATVTIHSGADAYSNPPTDLFWVYAYYWHNEGDEAVLYNSSNQVIDSYCYLAGCP